MFTSLFKISRKKTLKLYTDVLRKSTHFYDFYQKLPSIGVKKPLRLKPLFCENVR